MAKLLTIHKVPGVLRVPGVPKVHRFIAMAVVLALAGGAGPSAQQGQKPVEQPRFEGSTSITLVSVDVVVRDSKGEVVRGLTAKDFTILEDGKPQKIDNFSFQEIASSAPAGALDVQLLDGLEDKVRAEAARAATATAATPEPAAPAGDPAGTMNRRMLMIMFDVSSMQPDDVQRAVEDARDWVGEKMTGADLIAIITIGTRLNVLTDFTSSKEEALTALQKLAYNEGTEVDPQSVATAATEADAAEAGTTTTEADAFQEFNNDVRLRALKTVCQELAPIQQKKALLYFSAGMNRSGEDNQIELRNATSTCNRGNVSIYPVDTRGLQAVAAGGGAASRGNGRSLLTGQGMRGFQQLNQSQETLTTLAADTGGRAFTDTNDFGDAFARVQRDLAAYYLLGYSSTNPSRDGRFRRITVRVNANRPELKGISVDARQGYYAGRSFANTNNRDREAQLDDQLQAAVSSTDVPMVVGTGYFRQQGGGQGQDPRDPRANNRNLERFYVPIALAVPGFAIPVADKATEVQIDVKGEVRDEQSRVIGRLRETIKVPSGGADTLAGRQVFYQSGLSLPPGRFIVKVVLRENTGGAVGSFEAPIIVPPLNDSKVMKVSSVVMSTQVQKAAAGRTDNPLVRDGVQLLPNLTRAVGRNQKVYFYYEVYDPALTAESPDLRTSLAFYRGGVKVFETPMVTRTMLDEAARRAVVFQFEVPAEQFKPGTYTCQINIVDAIASTVAFPRLSFVVMD
jgi:VWFA-related protein